MPDDLLARLGSEARACRLCRDAPASLPALAEPRPIFQVSAGARLCIASQAPGLRAHTSGVPFDDRSGDRLRDWMGIDRAAFYDERRVAILPMGFCFPGYDRHGGDLPPRPECAPHWRQKFLDVMPGAELILCVGAHAQAWHLGSRRAATMTDTVRDWRRVLDEGTGPRILPLPHPSWRNSGWLKRHPWFEAELLPRLRAEVATLMRPTGGDRPIGQIPDRKRRPMTDAPEPRSPPPKGGEGPERA